MKKVSFCQSGKIFIIFMWLLLIAYYVWALKYCIEKRTADNISTFINLVCLFSLVYLLGTISFIFNFIWLSGAMRLYENKIETRMKITRKYQTFPIDKIHEIVIQCESILTKNTSSNLSLRINSSHGFVLAYGRTALRALLRTYPNMKFRVKYTGYLLGRKNAILLSQRGYLGVHKRRAVAKLFHIREEKLTPIEKSNPTDE